MLKRFILWDFPRASWQYDVMVGLILAFILLTPRAWFRDQPRIPNARSIAMLPSENGSLPFWIDPDMLGATPEAARPAKLTQVLRAQTGNYRLSVTRVEEIRSSEDELLGYMAFARP
ncbi:MAG: hypothetical protein ABSC23_20635 [Bryobacteraceae bacterium]|jgi:hypothetical protein